MHNREGGEGYFQIQVILPIFASPEIEIKAFLYFLVIKQMPLLDLAYKNSQIQSIISVNNLKILNASQIVYPFRQTKTPL